MIMMIMTTLCIAAVSAEIVAVSHLGFHPDSNKRVIYYSDAQDASFIIKNANDGSIAYEGDLYRPTDYYGEQTACQGFQSCLIYDFTGFEQQGAYYVEVNGKQSHQFEINTQIYQDTTGVLLEFFNAMRMQDSDYHANWHENSDPPFTNVADGAIMMLIDQATLTLMRLGNAYKTNPHIFNVIDNYDMEKEATPDMLEHIYSYTQYIMDIQDHDGTYAVPRGWHYDFTCWPDVDDLSVPQWVNETDPCMDFREETSPVYTAMALHAYVQSLPALHAYDPQVAEDVLWRAIHTKEHMDAEYEFIGNNDHTAHYGAALFLMYSYTGNIEFLQEAHSLQSYVNQNFISDVTRGNEFYWEEYHRNKVNIINADLEYEMNGNEPVDFLRNKLFFDYKDAGMFSLSNTGEVVYQFDHNINFQNSRYMLLEGIFAAKAKDMDDQVEDFVPLIADMQLAWLTGMNAVRLGNLLGPIGTISFIFGIGDFPEQQHNRITKETDDVQYFTNGLTYVPGWINGPFNINNDYGDYVFNYVDSSEYWAWTESTNEITAIAIELIAYLDARYNDKQGIEPFIIIDMSGPDTMPPVISNGQPVGELPSGTTDTILGVDTNKNAACRLSTEDVFFDEMTEFDDTGFTMHSHANSGLEDGVSYKYFVRCMGENGQVNTNAYVIAFNIGDTHEPTQVIISNGLPKGMLAAGSTSATLSVQSNIDAQCAYANEQGTPFEEMSLFNETGLMLHEQEIEGLIDGESYSYYLLCVAEDIMSEEYTITFSVEHNSSEVCYEHVNDIPATCQGGKITEDEWNGCRQIICTSGDDYMAVLACNKPDEGHPQFFEMYKQAESGESIEEICLGNTCIRDNGFAKSGQYPICLDGGPSEESLKLKIAQWYPQENNYVFICEATGFTPTSYDWVFGDGHKLLGMSFDNVYHTYEQPGSYTPQCTAYAEGIEKTATLEITVDGEEYNTQETPQNSNDDTVDMKVSAKSLWWYHHYYGNKTQECMNCTTEQYVFKPEEAQMWYGLVHARLPISLEFDSIIGDDICRPFDTSAVFVA